MRMGWGVVKKPVCIGEGAKNFRGSHLGELGVFCFIFYEGRREPGKRKTRLTFCTLKARLQVASQGYRSFPKGLRMPQVFFPTNLAPEE